MLFFFPDLNFLLHELYSDEIIELLAMHSLYKSNRLFCKGVWELQ